MRRVPGENISPRHFSTFSADAVLTHRSERGGFFTLILQPPQRVTAEDVTKRSEVIDSLTPHKRLSTDCNQRNLWIGLLFVRLCSFSARMQAEPLVIKLVLGIHD